MNLYYNFFAWRKNPSELSNGIIYGNEPEKFIGPKHRLHEIVLFLTRLAFRPAVISAMTKVYAKTPLRPLSFGYFTTVFQQDDGVVKIYEWSTCCSEAERQQLVRVLQESFNIAQKYLGGYINPTKISIEKHPIFKTGCVVLRQPLVVGKALAGRSYTKQLSRAQRIQFARFLELNNIMRKETGWTADINGHNLFAVNDSVVLVDTMPSGQVVAKNRRTTLSILEREKCSLRRLKIL